MGLLVGWIVDGLRWRRSISPSVVVRCDSLSFVASPSSAAASDAGWLADDDESAGEEGTNSTMCMWLSAVGLE